MPLLERRKLLRGALAAASVNLVWPAGRAHAVPASQGPAPDFSLDELDGRTHRLQAAFASLGLFSPMPTFPILLDRKGQVAQAYGVEGLP